MGGEKRRWEKRRCDQEQTTEHISGPRQGARVGAQSIEGAQGSAHQEGLVRDGGAEGDHITRCRVDKVACPARRITMGWAL